MAGIVNTKRMWIGKRGEERERRERRDRNEKEVYSLGKRNCYILVSTSPFVEARNIERHGR